MGYCRLLTLTSVDVIRQVRRTCIYLSTGLENPRYMERIEFFAVFDPGLGFYSFFVVLSPQNS